MNISNLTIKYLLSRSNQSLSALSLIYVKTFDSWSFNINMSFCLIYSSSSTLNYTSIDYCVF